MKFTFEPGSRPLEGFVIKRGIDRGGFGEVYYAHSDAGKEVALKLLQQNMEIELRGVRQCINLKHPNLVHLFDIRQDADGDHWIVMEYVSGKSLEQIIAAHPQGLRMEDTCRWLQGMADGLAFLHDRGIVHRDVKPGNIFIEDGHVRIGDVGLSKFITASRRNAQSQSVGTVYYMAPEVAKGEYGREVDVYSLAVMLYEMVTGRIPFDGESTAEIMMKHLTEQPDLSPLPPALRPVLARALEKDPMKRTPDVQRLATDFIRAARGQSVAIDLPEESFAGSVPVAETRSPAAEASPAPRRRLTGAEIREKRHAERERRRKLKIARKATRKLRKAERKAEQAMAQYRRGHGPVPAGAVPVHHHDSSDDDAAVNSAVDEQHSGIHSALWIVAGAMLFLAVFAPGVLGRLLPHVFRFGALAALGYGGYWLFRQMLGTPSSTLPAEAQLAAAAVPAGAPQQVPVRYHQSNPAGNLRLGPETPRHVPLHQRLTDLTGSLTIAVPVTALITAGLWQFTPLLETPAQAGVFGGTTLLASWLLLSLSLLREGRSTETDSPRLWQLAAGLLTGAGARWLDQTLLVSIPGVMFSEPHGLFQQLGSHRLLEAGGQPALTGYLVFFGGLFALRRWWRHGDPFRKRRFRTITLLLTAMLAYGLTSVWAFPHMWGTLLAASVSSVVQLAAPWVPRNERPARMGVTQNV